MSKKLKGFSLAELLISLLVISIVLSAAIPTITKRTAQEREQIWKWSTDNNSTFFGLGSNQAVLVGISNVPTGELSAFMDDDYRFESYPTIGYHKDAPAFVEPLYIKNATFTTDGDKLMLLKKSIPGESTVSPADHKSTNMGNSHISFYNIENGAERSHNNVSYGGRIAVDRHNIAFGIGTLLHQENVLEKIGTAKNVDLWAKNFKVLDKDGDQDIKQFVGENTAIGHYALMANTKGFRNVAIGEKTLSNNREGSFNTAIGFLAANKIGREKYTDKTTYRISDRTVNKIKFDELAINGKYASENTAIGSSALTFNVTGFGNTAVGADSLKRVKNGDDNVGLGYFALGELNQGFGNVSLGTNSCYTMTEGNYNICIGNSVLNRRPEDSSNPKDKFKDNFALAIGSTPTVGAGEYNDIVHSIPLITGHTQRVGTEKITASNEVSQNTKGNYDKELIVNSKHVKFKPFAGGNTSAFTFTSVPGDMYNANNKGYGVNDNFETPNMTAEAFFNLRYFQPEKPENPTDSVTMGFTAQPNLALITSFNPSTIDVTTGKAAYTNLLINDLLITAPGGAATSIPINSNIRSIRNKVGIVTAVADDVNAPDLTINNKLNISRDAVHTINVDNEGIQIWGRNNGANKNDFEINLTGSEGSPDLRMSAKGQFVNFKVPQTGFFFYNGSGSGNYLAMAKNEITIGKDYKLFMSGNSDIHMEGLVVGSSVKTAINELNAKIEASYSDARLKNIAGDNTAGLAEINKIEVKNYTYKKDEKKTPHVGVIAQQLQKIFPNAVTKGDDGYLRIRTEDIFYAMVNSIKELCAKLQDLTAKVVGLDKRITELEAQNKMLLEQNKAFEKRLEKLEKQAAK